ncbi:hypothetical protein THRCLA_01914 [Thraustotheca clavata]|uniref:AMP-dependent synthetase/ligase domain-containing protein n=1 Tax=Thraustotheca clavata TaxID=74557 RepID=A0A1W0A6U9_9STRA|nr:hypothetical protein THRCLA_01914 [Thraustotheca clavata]
MIHYGASIGFFQGNTPKLMDDLCEFCPTLFVTVPSFLNEIYHKIVNGANAGGGFKAWLFKYAIETKMAKLKRRYTAHPLHAVLVGIIVSEEEIVNFAKNPRSLTPYSRHRSCWQKGSSQRI